MKKTIWQPLVLGVVLGLLAGIATVTGLSFLTPGITDNAIGFYVTLFLLAAAHRDLASDERICTGSGSHQSELLRCICRCICRPAAIESGGTVLTGDREFEQVEGLVKVEWLNHKT